MKSSASPKRDKKSLSSTRWTLQIITLFSTALIGLRHILPGESSRGGSFDTFCPFGGIETLWPYLSTGTTLKTTNLLNFSILLGVLGVALLAGRAFCGWLCPVGTTQDIMTDLGRRLTRKKSGRSGKRTTSTFPRSIHHRWDPWLRKLKYLILAVIVLVSSWTVFPPLRQICPARALFSFQLTAPLLVSVLILFLVSSLLVKRFSCKYLCPLGAVLAPFNKIAPLRLTVNQKSCTSCGRCDAECPMDIEDIPHNLRSAECSQCLICQETCAIQDTLKLKLG